VRNRCQSRIGQVGRSRAPLVWDRWSVFRTAPSGCRNIFTGVHRSLLSWSTVVWSMMRTVRAFSILLLLAWQPSDAFHVHHLFSLRHHCFAALWLACSVFAGVTIHAFISQPGPTSRAQVPLPVLHGASLFKFTPRIGRGNLAVPHNFLVPPPYSCPRTGHQSRVGARGLNAAAVEPEESWVEADDGHRIKVQYQISGLLCVQVNTSPICALSSGGLLGSCGARARETGSRCCSFTGGHGRRGQSGTYRCRGATGQSFLERAPWI
jgi:hypothetical protein